MGPLTIAYATWVRRVLLGVLRAISEGENRFSDRPEEPYVLVTSISARRFGEFEDVGEIGGCGLAFERFLSEPFRSEHEKAKLMGENQVLGRFPRPGNTMRSYAGVRVSVSGRSHEEAKERALDILDLLRGIWNLGINRYIGDRTSAGIRTSNNKFSLGPVHSLHHPDGRRAVGGGGLREADHLLPYGSRLGVRQGVRRMGQGRAGADPIPTRP